MFAGIAVVTILVGAVAVVGLLFASAWFLDVGFTGVTNQGVTVELASAVLSGFALFGVLVTIVLQHKELKLAHDELQETQTLLREQRNEMKQSAEALKIQNFESTFFRMLEVLERVRQDVTYPSRDMSRIYEGRVAMRAIADLVDAAVKPAPTDKLGQAYMDIYEKKLADKLGQFFRTLYRTLDYVDKSPIERKSFYAGILRAQMGDSELFILFYNCLSPLGQEKALPLIEKYHFFDNFPKSKLANPEKHRSLIKSRFADDK